MRLPFLKSADTRVEGLLIQKSFGEDRVFGSLESGDQVGSDSLESLISSAAPEEDATVAKRGQSSLSEQRHESTPDVGVITKLLEGTDVGIPEGTETSGLGPGTKVAVIVVGDEHSSAGTKRTDHLRYDRSRVGNMLQEKASMSDVEATPFRLVQWKLQRIALAKLHKSRLARTVGESFGLRKLLLISLHADHLSRAAHGASHQTRELTKPAAEIQDSLSGTETELSQAGLIQDVVEQGQPVLFLRRTAMNVLG